MGYYTYTYTASFTISPRLVASALVIGPIAYLMYVHQDLSHKTHHTTRSGTLTTSTTNTIDSIPLSSLEEGCHMFHDTASKSIPTAHLPAIDTNAMLTQYLRYNMSRFSRFPQAWIIYLMIPSAERGTFAKEHIQHLDFKEGDVVCGSYKVALRTAQKVEFAMKPIGSVDGRMVTSITQSGGDYIFRTEKIMWTHPDKKSLMPLERGIGRWLHELTSWFLLDSGTKYLVQLGQRT